MKYFNLLLALLLGFALVSTLRADDGDDDNSDEDDANDDDDDGDDDDRLFWLFRPRPTVRPFIPIRVQQRCPIGSQCIISGCTRRSDCYAGEFCCTSRNNRNVRCCVSRFRPSSVSTTTAQPTSTTSVSATPETSPTATAPTGPTVVTTSTEAVTTSSALSSVSTSASTVTGGG